MKHTVQLYSVRGAAEFLSTSGTQIGRHIESGQLRASNIGTQKRKSWRITAEALDEFLEARATAPPPKKKRATPRIKNRKWV